MNGKLSGMVIKNLYTSKILCTIVFLLLVIPATSQDKQGKIKGRVFNAANNEGVPFATVVIVGTTTGAMTDFDGNFTFTGIDPGYIQLKASSVGFEAYVSNSFLVTRDKIVSIDLPLKESVVGIDDVVVKASPFRKKLESPVSVRIIGIEEIEKNLTGLDGLVDGALPIFSSNDIMHIHPGGVPNVLEGVIDFLHDILIRAGIREEDAGGVDEWVELEVDFQ